MHRKSLLVCQSGKGFEKAKQGSKWGLNPPFDSRNSQMVTVKLFQEWSPYIFNTMEFFTQRYWDKTICVFSNTDGWMDNTKYLVCRSGYKISLLKCLPNKTTLILNCTFVMSTLPVHEDFYKVVKRSKSLSACSLQSVFVCLSVWYPSVNAHAITGHSKQNTQIRTQYRAMWCS